MTIGYLDAGTGSLLVQAILGGAAGLGVAWKALKMRLARTTRVAKPDHNS